MILLISFLVLTLFFLYDNNFEDLWYIMLTCEHAKTYWIAHNLRTLIELEPLLQHLNSFKDFCLSFLAGADEIS
jgi:hypothetical protein